MQAAETDVALSMPGECRHSCQVPPGAGAQQPALTEGSSTPLRLCCPLPLDVKVIILMKSSPFPQVPPG